MMESRKREPDPDESGCGGDDTRQENFTVVIDFPPQSFLFLRQPQDVSQICITLVQNLRLLIFFISSIYG
jgi:hypothetical protein